MAEEAKAPAAADAAKPTEESTRPTDAAAEIGVAEAKPAGSGDVAMSGEAAKGPKSSAKPDAPADEATAGGANADTEKAGDDTAPVADTNGTPASTKKGAHNRRKSGAGVPEHKKKTPNKKKAIAELRLNVQPGEMYAVAMKGYPPWPVIVCDESMLPESLLSKRPVSAKRIDGTYREDFRDGGKNAKDRRYPVMFLGTNEFSWEVNTHLQSLDVDEVKKEVEAGNTQKKSKALWSAYEVAAEGHDLQWFKDLLARHEQALQADAEEKAAKQEKKAKRKSAAVEEVEDVEMEDAEDDAEVSTKKTKQSKKRKKDVESDGEPEKPAKTPKTKLKLNNKPPKDTSASKPKKESKPKKAKASSESAEAEPAKVEEKPMTETERREKQEKSVLYLRHRLQKGFLARDQAPKEEEMANMNDYLKQLEEFANIEAETIRKTKVHKVLKAIVKLNSIPREDEFNFKARSQTLLVKWSGSLATEEPSGEASAPAAEPTTNGVKHDEKKEDITTPMDKSERPTNAAGGATATNGDGDGNGDVSMAEAKNEKPTETAEPIPSKEGTTETATV